MMQVVYLTSGLILMFVALAFGLDETVMTYEGTRQNLTAGFASLGFSYAGGMCLLGSCLLPRTKKTRLSTAAHGRE